MHTPGGLFCHLISPALVVEVVKDGTFGIDEQKKFEEQFGVDTTDKVKQFLADLSAAEVDDVVFERFSSAREELEKLIPLGFDAAIKTMRHDV